MGFYGVESGNRVCGEMKWGTLGSHRNQNRSAATQNLGCGRTHRADNTTSFMRTRHRTRAASLHTSTHRRSFPPARPEAENQKRPDFRVLEPNPITGVRHCL